MLRMWLPRSYTAARLRGANSVGNTCHKLYWQAALGSCQLTSVTVRSGLKAVIRCVAVPLLDPSETAE